MAFTTASDITPRDVANEAESLAAGIPQHLISLLLHMSVVATSDAETLIAKKRAEMDERLSYFKHTFERSFSQAADTVSETLSDANAELVMSLQKVLDDLPAGETQAEILTELAGRVEENIALAVSAFRTALFDQVLIYEKANSKTAKDLDSSSLTEIDLISRKINSIAINASVEAARAGDFGRGFAVIAAEIKELSQKSKEAVERIRVELQ